jgi:hypothetical protein
MLFSKINSQTWSGSGRLLEGYPLIGYETTFQLEDELTVTFELGTSQQLEFNATIQIRHIDSSMNIGGAFVESSAEKHLEMATLFL